MNLTTAEATRFVVVDASVSLKWVLNDEEAVAEAIALRDAAADGALLLVAPSLWRYEVINGLVVAARRRRVGSEDAAVALSLLFRLGVQLADPEDSDVYELAQQHGLAAYDSAYLALAIALGAELWTGDRRFFDAVQQRLGFVGWIGNYPIR